MRHHLDRALQWRVVVAASVTLGALLVGSSTGEVVAAQQTVPAASEQTSSASGPSTRVIVESDPGQAQAAASSATRLGGTVVATQASLDTVVVDLPAGAIGALRSADGVVAVTEDTQVRLQSLSPGLSTETNGSMVNVTRFTGATTYWRNGFVGRGVDVALLDSGVLPVEGLLTPNKLVIGPDLSFESQQPSMANLDSFGHGTHLAGIIGGLDRGVTSASVLAGTPAFLGMAPGARIVSLKIADARGNTDVSQVIAAIDWVVTHAQENGLNIRVINLSFGTDSTQDYRLDPLAHATEVAAEQGLVVVVSAGNGGGDRVGLANPAFDPAVIAVGAVNTRGTFDRADDYVPAFSQRGATAEGKRGPDLVAPGVSLVGLRARNSFIDQMHGHTGAVDDRFFKGSGTSQAAAVVSGAAALVLSHRPALTPEQVRDVLRRSARNVPGASYDAQGAGSLDLTAAFSTTVRGVTAPRVNPGGGSLDKARGKFKVKKNGVPLTGEQDIFGNHTDTGDLAQAQESGTPWSGGSYNGATWAGGGWLGATWAGATWAGATWAGATWAGATWAGATWAGATWAGATWAGATWAGGEWNGATWAGASWADAEWANDLWSSAGWE